MIISDFKDKMELPYWQKLEEIRLEFESKSLSFPRNKCQLVTRAVSLDTKLRQVAGLYVPERSWHAWNYDPQRRLYIDLSMDQFEEVEEKIVIISCERRDVLQRRIWDTCLQRAEPLPYRYDYFTTDFTK